MIEFSRRRMMWRMFLTANTLALFIWTPVAIFLFHFQMKPLLIYTGVNLIPSLFVLVDALVVFVYARRIQPIVRAHAFRDLFFIGATWAYLRDFAKDLAPRLTSLRQDAQRLGVSQEFEKTLKSEGFLGVLSLVRRAERKAAAAAHREERRKRNAARQTSELERIAIAIAERKKKILSQAAGLDCIGRVQEVVDEGKFELAESMVLRVALLIQSARRHGIEAEVRANIAQDCFPAAEELIDKAEKRVKRQNLCAEIERRISALPGYRQSEPKELLGRLSGEEYGTRPFRIIHHEIERSIGA